MRQVVFPNEHFVQYITKSDSPYESYKEFYYTSGKLKTEGQNFYGREIGVWKNYDENGSLVEETDYDAPFKFSIEALSIEMKKRGVDIMHPSGGYFNVSRSTNLLPYNTPFYQVYYSVTPGNIMDLNYIVFDGITGKIIKQTVVHNSRYGE